MGYVWAKIGLTRQFDRRQPGNYLQPWAFQVSGPPQLLCVSLMIVYACQDHVLESLKMAFFILILDSKYSKMSPKFVKQKSHWLLSSIKFANPDLLSLIHLNKSREDKTSYHVTPFLATLHMYIKKYPQILWGTMATIFGYQAPW